MSNTLTDIGTLIDSHPGIHGGCPLIAGTGVTVRRIAIWYKQGLSSHLAPVALLQFL